jgi:hypothetical protein
MVFCFGLFIFIEIIPAVSNSTTEIKDILWFFYLLAIFFAISGGVLTGSNILFGSMYRESIQIPMKEFQVDVLENMTIFKFKNRAYTSTYNQEKLLAQKHIHCVQYYNRKKKAIGYQIFIAQNA